MGERGDDEDYEDGEAVEGPDQEEKREYLVVAVVVGHGVVYVEAGRQSVVMWFIGERERMYLLWCLEQLVL